MTVPDPPGAPRPAGHDDAVDGKPTEASDALVVAPDSSTRSDEPHAARWEDYIDIFFSPAGVFRRRAADPAGPPLITLLVLGMVLYIALIPANRAIIAASAPAADPAAAAFIEEWGGMLQLLGVIAVPITTLVMVGFAALVLWLAAKLFSVELAPGRAFLISTYAGFVLLVGQVVAALLVLLQSGGPIDLYRDLSIGALRFYPAGEIPATTVAVLRRLDVFALWQAALWAVGVHIVARTSAGRAAAVAAAAWVLLAVPSFLMALIRTGAPGT